MRTALILLLVLALASSVGSFFPQRPVNAGGVADWIDRNPGWAPLAEALGLFDVYGSWWFMTVYALLVVSLVGCLVPRYRAVVRAIQAQPKPRGSLAGVGPSHAGVVALAPERALAGAERVLRRRRFRIARQDGRVFGEKGHVREAGSLVFHTAFLVLIVGISVGKGFGFTGQVGVVEGDAFTDTHVAYDSISEGRFFGEGHRGFRLALDAFDVSFHANGVPREFASRVRVYEGERLVRREAIRVNEPLTYRGVRVYQLGWGWAPRVRVEQDGRVLHDAPVIFLQDRRSGVFRGVVKAPGARPSQLGLEMFFFNDLDVTDDDVPFNRSQLARNPVLFYQEYRGDLLLDRPQSVYELDPRGLSPGASGVIRRGEDASLPDGMRISFPSLRQYSVFQVGSDPGLVVVLAAATMILVGLIPALYSSRRRVWVSVSGAGAEIPARGGSAARLEVAGQALQRKAAFEEEFTELVREIGRDLKEEIERETAVMADG